VRSTDKATQRNSSQMLPLKEGRFELKESLTFPSPWGLTSLIDRRRGVRDSSILCRLRMFFSHDAIGIRQKYDSRKRTKSKWEPVKEHRSRRK